MPEILRIENKDFQKNPLRNMLSPYQKDRVLHTLVIINCEINSAEIDEIISFVLNNRNIKTLSLIKTKLHGKPVHKFKSILYGDHGVKHIHLSGNSLTINELIAMKILDENNSLISCDIFPIVSAYRLWENPHEDIVVELDDQKIDDLFFKYLAMRLSHYAGPSKVILNLKNNLLTTVSVPFIRELLIKNRLKGINLSKNKFSESDWESIGDAIAVSQIEEIDMSYNNLQDKVIVLLFKNIRNHPGLRAINLIDNNIGDVGAQAIARLLADNSKIRHLNLSYNNINALGASYISDALKNNTSLNVLILNSNNLADAGAIFLGAVLQHLRSLSTLELYSNNITNQGAKILVQTLGTNTALKKLNIAANMLTAPIVVFIEQMLMVNSTLEICDISENKIEEAALAPLQNNPRVLTNYNDTSSNLRPAIITASPPVNVPPNIPAVLPVQLQARPTLIIRGYVNPETVIPYSPQIDSTISRTTYFSSFFLQRFRRQVNPTTTIQPHQKDVYPINSNHNKFF